MSPKYEYAILCTVGEEKIFGKVSRFAKDGWRVVSTSAIPSKHGTEYSVWMERALFTTKAGG